MTEYTQRDVPHLHRLIDFAVLALGANPLDAAQSANWPGRPPAARASGRCTHKNLEAE